MAIEIVSFPIKNGDFPYIAMLVYQRVKRGSYEPDDSGSLRQAPMAWRAPSWRPGHGDFHHLVMENHWWHAKRETFKVNCCYNQWWNIGLKGYIKGIHIYIYRRTSANSFFWWVVLGVHSSECKPWILVTRGCQILRPRHGITIGPEAVRYTYIQSSGDRMWKFQNSPLNHQNGTCIFEHIIFIYCRMTTLWYTSYDRTWQWTMVMLNIGKPSTNCYFLLL